MTDPTSSQAREALNALECRIPMELARTHGAVIRAYIERAERAGMVLWFDRDVWAKVASAIAAARD